MCNRFRLTLSDCKISSHTTTTVCLQTELECATFGCRLDLIGFLPTPAFWAVVFLIILVVLLEITLHSSLPTLWECCLCPCVPVRSGLTCFSTNHGISSLFQLRPLDRPPHCHWDRNRVQEAAPLCLRRERLLHLPDTSVPTQTPPAPYSRARRAKVRPGGNTSVLCLQKNNILLLTLPKNSCNFVVLMLIVVVVLV